MSTLEMLRSVQFVVGPDGQPSAVQMGIDVWQSLLDWMEDIEDRSWVRELLPRLRSGPKTAGALRWEDVRAEWSPSASE